MKQTNPVKYVSGTSSANAQPDTTIPRGEHEINCSFTICVKSSETEDGNVYLTRKYRLFDPLGDEGELFWDYLGLLVVADEGLKELDAEARKRNIEPSIAEINSEPEHWQIRTGTATITAGEPTSPPVVARVLAQEEGYTVLAP